MRTPGPGDQVTWPECTGHPNDPRTPEDEYEDDGLSDLNATDLRILARELIVEKQQLIDGMQAVLLTFFDGTHYKTCNPYLRPEIRQAMVALAKAKGRSSFGYDWQDAMSDETAAHFQNLNMKGPA